MQNSSDDSLSCGAWHRSGTKFYVGGQRGQFFECVSQVLLTRSVTINSMHSVINTYTFSNQSDAIDTSIHYSHSYHTNKGL